MKNHDYDIAKILVQKPGINLDIIDQNGISFTFILLNSENLELIEQIVKVLKNRIFLIQNPFNLTHVNNCDSSKQNIDATIKVFLGTAHIYSALLSTYVVHVLF